MKNIKNNKKIDLYYNHPIKSVNILKDINKYDDEFLDVIKMPIKEVITKIMTNEIKDSKTIAAVFKLKELMNL